VQWSALTGVLEPGAEMSFLQSIRAHRCESQPDQPPLTGADSVVPGEYGAFDRRALVARDHEGARL
jgi:hypothetical protein